MKMDAGLDTGPMLSQEKTPILENDNGQTLHDRLAVIGAELLLRTIPGYIDGTIIPVAQPEEGVSYARKISKNDGLIDWNKPARSLFNQIRALTPWPGSFTYLNDPQRLLKIWRVEIGPFEGDSPGTILASDHGSLVVSCSDGNLRIEELQIEGGKRLSVRQFLAGHPIPIGTKLGSIAS